jgi:polysaccharide pyruvyl transferase WcaK-like protein
MLEIEHMTRTFPRFHLLQTAIASDNVGDEIIVEDCLLELQDVLKGAYVSTSSSHDGLGPSGRELAAEADVVLMLGTNALRDRTVAPWKHYMWKLSRRDVAALEDKVVLMGVGANRAFKGVSAGQKRLLSRILSSRHVHSVRDESARKIIAECGRDVVNTSCPTLWKWRSASPGCPTGKAENACFTLTKHKPDPVADTALVRTLKANYGTVWFWPQQPRDLGYLDSLGETGGIEVIAPNLAAYDEILAGNDVDVIGTRLHGTIRALKHGRRHVVIAIDRRSTEIGAHTGLSVMRRDKVATELEGRVNSEFETRLDLDSGAIDRFLGQFG